MNTGFFTMDTVIEVCNQRDLQEAKKIAVTAVESSEAAKKENTRKAIQMIDKAKTVEKLGISMSNFLLAHPSENLKTIT